VPPRTSAYPAREGCGRCTGEVELTEVLQPPLAASQPSRTAPAASTHAHAHDPSFTELVYAHYAWWHELRNDAPAAASDAYHQLLARFERTHGKIVHSFWCTHLESAVALTEHKARFR